MHSSRHRLVLRATACAIALSVVAVPAALTRPAIRSSFFSAHPSAVGSALDNLPSHPGHCGVCHYDFNGGGTRNPYGVRLGNVLPSYPNTDAGRQQAMHAIENEDPDGDLFSTLQELTNLSYSNTPTFPGLTMANVGNTKNVSVLAELTPHLVPQTATDTQPPVANLVSPIGGGTCAAGEAEVITWSASDNTGVTAVDLFWRDAPTSPWKAIALGVPNTGSRTWFVPNMPTSSARILVLAWDANGNLGRDSSSTDFTVTAQTGIAPTTLRDFELPGSQPLSVPAPEHSSVCLGCHSGYDAANEPGRLFQGSMMAQAGRDPLFYACLAIAEQDAPSSGDLCIRCHSMTGWMAGRSQPTDASQLVASDRDGVNCDLCHRLVDPVYQTGVSPAEDAAILGGMLPAHVPANYSNGQMVLDPQARRRGPFSDTVAPHQVLTSPFHRSGEFCGTCHDVSNPVFVRTGAADYAPGPLDQAPASMHSTDIMPLERTYSEWKHSAFPAGVFAPQFAGNLPGGTVRTCQDCHMSDANARGANDPLAPLRPDMPRHDMTGGSAWMVGVVSALYPGETNPMVLAEGAARARELLAKAATLDLSTSAEAESTRLQVRVTNHTGHKLPTGYPEGRRMWLHVTAHDDHGAKVFESGAYDADTGVLSHDASLRVYETHLGISPALATALGQSAGPSFHFALNDTVYLDNRIPPLGFVNATFAAFGGAPVDPEHPGSPRYADGQNWDVAEYALPRSARQVTVRLLYQSTSKEYVEFLRDRNTTNNAGQALHDAWVANGRAAPEQMARDSVLFTPLAVGGGAARTAWSLQGNPFRGALRFEVSLQDESNVAWSVYDAQGRALAQQPAKRLPAGRHAFEWNGRDRSGGDAGAGVFWLRLDAGAGVETRRIVRIR